MSKMKSAFARLVLGAGALVVSQSSIAVSIEWVHQSGDSLTSVGGYDILEYMNAGTGGIDWTLTELGSTGGNGTSQLWLTNAPTSASVTFTVPSSAVSFMIHGDSNDGFAEFFVDYVLLGSFDLYNLGHQSLVVSDLAYSVHTLSVVQTGERNPSSSGDDVAIYGGAAISASVPEPPVAALWLLGLFNLAWISRHKKCAQREG